MADKLVENVISTLEMPLSVAPNFRVNGKDYLVPMAIEEPSVVAACSNAARIAREGGGFRAYATEPLMYGQVQVIGVPDPTWPGWRYSPGNPRSLNWPTRPARPLNPGGGRGGEGSPGQGSPGGA